MEYNKLSDQVQKFIKERADAAGITVDDVLRHFETLSRGRGVSKHSCVFTGHPGEVYSFLESGCLYTRKVWATAKSIRAEIADIPEHTLAEFAVAHPDDVRKYGESRNSTLVFRTAAVLKFIEDMKEAK